MSREGMEPVATVARLRRQPEAVGRGGAPERHGSLAVEFVKQGAEIYKKA